MNQTTEKTQTVSQRPLVKDMDEQARIAYLAGLMGKRVRFANVRDTAPLLQAFGAYAVIPWKEGVADSFTLDGANKMFVLEMEPWRLSIGTVPRKESIRLDLLYDVQAIEPTPEPEHDMRGFGSEDLYRDDEFNCPQCGHKLRLVQQATVRLADDDEEDDDA